MIAPGGFRLSQPTAPAGPAGVAPYQSGANSGGIAPRSNVGWQNKGNRNPNGFGGASSANPPVMQRNPDSGGGTSVSMRAPGVSGSAITPPRGGGRMAMSGGFANLM